MSVMSAFDLAAKFAVGGFEIVEVVHTSLEKAAVIVETRAKEIIGDYQTDTGPFDPWAELADATKADRVSQGYTANDPLLREGDLRDSIEHYTDGSKALVGSDSDIAVYQELGTPNAKHPIPARSFLGAAAFQKQDEVAELIGDAVFTMLAGGMRGTSF